MLPYYKKQSQLLNDNRTWSEFLAGRKSERGEAEKEIKELELSIEKESVKEKPEEKEIIKIEGIPESAIIQISDWLRKGGKAVDEENIRLSYERFK